MTISKVRFFFPPLWSWLAISNLFQSWVRFNVSVSFSVEHWGLSGSLRKVLKWTFVKKHGSILRYFLKQCIINQYVWSYRWQKPNSKLLRQNKKYISSFRWIALRRKLESRLNTVRKRICSRPPPTFLSLCLSLSLCFPLSTTCDPGNKLQAIICPALISQKRECLAHQLYRKSPHLSGYICAFPWTHHRSLEDGAA